MKWPVALNRTTRVATITLAVCGTSALLQWVLAKSGPKVGSAHCCAAAARPASQRSTARYQVPDVEMVRADGKTVHLRQEIDDGRPVILNFIFTTCAAICPVMSRTFEEVQRRLGDERGEVHLVSISIDPEQDTPARLSAYAKTFHAGPQWNFYTGALEASVAVQRAFEAYRGNKMNHLPATFLRAAPGGPWVRLEGFVRADDIVEAQRSSSRETDGLWKLGERIYREGVLPSGEPLRGLGAGNIEVAGAEAACVRCHRRSGMGTVEGDRIIPPITGRLLYLPRARTLAELDALHTRGPDLAHALGRDRPRAPYTDQRVARAIREGIDASEHPLDGLMPRYALGDQELQAITEYLKRLSAEWSPGATEDTVHFATVVTPGVDPARRKALLDVLGAFFAVRNESTRREKLREQHYPGGASAKYRSWQLHVWELAGAEETWESQLAAFERSQPVFAVLSGVSQGTWAPVSAFCEKRQMPCWFPTVDLAEASGDDFYTVYFNKGVGLEAEILAYHLKEGMKASVPADGVRRVLQIRGSDAAAAGAARALQKALAGAGIRVEERALRRVDAAAIRRATSDAKSADDVVLWLRAADLAHLAGVSVPPAAIFISATMGGGEHAPLPDAWRSRARLVYPFELPERRRANLTRFHAWLGGRGLPLVDERLQADAWLACRLMAEKIDEMLEHLYRDYLMERAESFLSMRLATAMYHRLSLGPAQRFASKGGYIARAAESDKRLLVAESGFITP